MRSCRPQWVLIALVTWIMLLSACTENEQAIPTPTLDLTPPPAEDEGSAPTPTSNNTTAQAAVSTATPLSDVQLISIGKQVYLENCASCHQLNGEGDDTYPPLNNNPVITSEDPAPAIALVLYGRGQMPAFREILSAEQIAAVLSYTRNAWDNNASTVSVDQVLAYGGIPAAGSPRMTPIPTATSMVTATATMTATLEVTGVTTGTE